MKHALATLALAALAFAALASPALAQDEAERTPMCELPNGEVVPCIVVHGRLQRPRAFYILPRARPADDRGSLRRSFTREVARSAGSRAL